MSWKNLTIGRKMAVGFGIVLILLASCVVLSFTGLRGIVSNAREVITGNKLDGTLAQKEIDHLTWCRKVNTLLTDEKVTKLEVQTDDHKCGFGKWLFGEGRKEAERLVPSLAPLLKEIEAPHHKLHQSAIAIGEHFKHADPNLPAFLAAKETDHLKWAVKVDHLFLDNLPELDVQTDDHKCGLGKWLYGGGAEKAVATNPALGPLIEDLKGHHQRLHQSVIGIQKVYAQVHPGLVELLMARLDDHRRWIEALATAIIEGKTNLGLQTDPSKCAFGKFLLSKELVDYQKGFPALTKAIEAIKEPHQQLHESAIAIQKATGQGDKAQAEQIFRTQTLTALEEVAKHFTAAINAEKDLNKAQQQAREIYETKTEQALHDTQEALGKVKAEAEQALDGMHKASEIYASETLPALTDVQSLLTRIREEARSNIMTDEALLSAAQGTEYKVGIIGVFALLVGIVLAYIITRSLVRPLLRAVNLAETIRTGDLSQRLGLNQADEIGQLSRAQDSMAEGLETKADLAARIADGDLTAEITMASDKDTLGKSLRNMVQSLNQVLGETFEASEQVANGSAQVSDSSQSLSQGATEQAASLEEVTSSMTEISAQTKTNAENASQANQLAINARVKADEGNSQMQEMISAMSEINDSSKEIAKIIKAIDDIAFQTNLLALNAAVEAARAGKHGKGFAVVAQEVRNLAGRSAKAAQETAELIEGSVQKVDHGSEIANKTAESLSSIVDGITKVADLVGEIAAASNEQALGLTQINLGLGQIEQVTQQNTANAEETASAAEELSSQAMQLKQLISRFKLKTQKEDRVDTRGGVHAPEAKQLTQASFEHDFRSVNRPESMSHVARPEDVISLDDRDFGKY